MKVISISLALLLAGCAANSAVIPSRPDTVVTPPAQAERAARPATAPPVPSQLTPTEQACKWWGEVYEWIGQERDKLIPITATIDNARKYAFRTLTNNATHAAEVAERIARTVRVLYAAPLVSGAEARYIAELECMKNAEATTATPAAAHPQY